MKIRSYLLYVSSFLVLTTIILNKPTQAQITPDNTLPSPTQVQKLNNINEITGGTQAGINLFHSFSQFSVPDGNAASFINNNPVIQNVISRVTGLSASKIFGKIQAGGLSPNFNFFLLNPNGIIFGPKASLNLNGSFIATTANEIEFGNQGSFSASTPNNPSLLTIQPSAFFFNQVRANPITYQGNKESMGLTVSEGKSLLFLGGNVKLDGNIFNATFFSIDKSQGILNAPDGRVELGGLAGTGKVALNVDDNNLSLSFPEGVERADVLLTNGANINVKNTGSGSISIYGRNIEFSGESTLFSGINEDLISENNETGRILLDASDNIILKESFIESALENNAQGNSGDIVVNAKSLSLNIGALTTTSLGKGNVGNIIINVSGPVTLAGKGKNENQDVSQINSLVFLGAEGNSGNIFIKAKSLSLTDGAAIQAFTVGRGNGGDITIKVDDFTSLDKGSQINSVVTLGAIGNGGTINVQTDSLSLKRGSTISAYVNNFEKDSDITEGNGGNIIINASEFVDISGIGVDGYSSGLSVSTETGAKGNAGNITVTTNSFRIAKGATIEATTFNTGKGGNITISANTFQAISGGQLLTTANDLGDAGNITVNATNLVRISGSDGNFAQRLQKFPDETNNQDAHSGIFAQSNSTGAAGNIIINTPQLIILDGGKVTVSSLQSQAGNININANSLFLNQGNLTAETGKSTEGSAANINLNIADLLTLDNESLISATANDTANGGNINIDSKFLVVFLSEGDNGSDIIAKADKGGGGQILINADGIFGITENKAINGNRNNDFDASSEFGAPGRVIINIQIKPYQDFVDLPQTVIDTSTLIDHNPCQKNNESKFIITGKGGLPFNVNPISHNEDTIIDLIELKPIKSPDSSYQEGETKDQNTNFSPSTSKNIVPAQGWIFNDKGEVVLVNYNPQKCYQN